MLSLVSDRIGGVMVSVCSSSALGQTKDNAIGICCFSTKQAALRPKTVLL